MAPVVPEAVNQDDRIVHFGMQRLGMQVEVDEVDEAAAKRSTRAGSGKRDRRGSGTGPKGSGTGSEGSGTGSEGSGTGPILLNQASFLLAHIANSGPVPVSASSLSASRFRRWAWICHLGPLSRASTG